MAGVFTKGSYTVPGTTRKLYYKYISTRQNDVSLASISGNCYASNSTSYGINGTYFYMDDPAGGYSAGDIYRIGINNGSVVKNNGSINRISKDADGTAKCGTFVILNSATPNGITKFVDDIESFSNYKYNGESIGLSKIKFAIGGINLYMNKSFSTASAYNRAIDGQLGGLGPNSQNHRTAILHTGDSTNNVVLFTVFSTDAEAPVQSKGVTLWELRTMLQSLFGSSDSVNGVILDGGGSTQIVYKENSLRKRSMTEDGVEKGVPLARAVQTMIRTTM